MPTTKSNNALRTLRRSRALSQQQLADLVGVSQQAIGRAERGTLKLRFDVQALIATILGGCVKDLFPQPEPDAESQPDAVRESVAR